MLDAPVPGKGRRVRQIMGKAGEEEEEEEEMLGRTTNQWRRIESTCIIGTNALLSFRARSCASREL